MTATGIDWDAVRKEMEREEWQRVEPDREERLVFLGTVFRLFPSGKYYMPWSTNVTEDEAKKDEEYRELLEEEAEEHGFFVTAGEGDPCDIFAGESRDVGESEGEW